MTARDYKMTEIPGTISTAISDEIEETGEQNFMQGIKDKVVVITGARSQLRKFSRAGSIRPPRSPRRPGRAG